MNTVKLNLTATVTSPEGDETTISHVARLLPAGFDQTHLQLMVSLVEFGGRVLGEDIGPIYGFERV